MSSAPAVGRRKVWQQALLALVSVIAVVIVAYRDTALSMVAIWSRSDTFAHAFLVLPIVLWLIWRRRRELALLQPQPCPWVLPPMAVIASVWMLGDLVSVNAVTQLSMTALLVLVVPAVLGLRVAGAIAFPLAFLFFAVPIGEFMLPQLMSWTADFTILALRASGIPVFREGQQFVIPSGRWAVVEACSGVRYLIASFMVGTLFAYLHYRSLRHRLVFIAVSIAVPIVGNWGRAYFIVMLGHLSGNKIAVGVDHLVYGWLFFGLIMVIMFTIGLWWSEPHPVEPAGPSRIPPIAPSGRRRLGPTWAAATVASVIALAPHLALQAIGEVIDGAPVRLASLGELPGDWRPQSPPKGGWKPEFQNPSAEASFAYAMNDRAVGLYVAYYRQQNYRRKLVSSTNELVNSTNLHWVQTSAPQPEALAVNDDTTLSIRSVALVGASKAGAPEQHLRVWQLYWVGDRLTSSDLRAKLYAAADRLLLRSDDAAVIVIYASDEPAGSARPVLQSFARANLGAIVARLRATRDSAAGTVVGVQ